MHPSLDRWLNRVVGLLAITVTFYGLANVMPAIGNFRLGPFPMEFFRATFFSLCLMAVGIDMMRTLPNKNNGVSFRRIA